MNIVNVAIALLFVVCVVLPVFAAPTIEGGLPSWSILNVSQTGSMVNTSLYPRDTSLPLTGQNIYRDVRTSNLNLYGGRITAGDGGIVSVQGAASGDSIVFYVPDMTLTANLIAGTWKGTIAQPYLDMNSHQIKTMADPTNNQDAVTLAYYNANLPAVVTDHGALTGLADDDHSAYPNLTGRPGGQTITGGTNIGDSLILVATSGGNNGNVTAQLGGTSSSSKFLIRDSDGIDRAYIDADGNALFNRFLLNDSWFSRTVNDNYLYLLGGTTTGDIGGRLALYGGDDGAMLGGAIFSVGDAAGTSSIPVWSVLGRTDTPSLSLNNHQIKSLQDPTAAQDAVTLNKLGTYVHNATGLSINGTYYILLDPVSEKVGINTPTPDSALHISRGSAGAVTAIAESALTIEDDAAVGINILTPSNKQGYLIFGDQDDNNIGYIEYDHITNALSFYIDAINRFIIYNDGFISPVNTSRLLVKNDTDTAISNAISFQTIWGSGGKKSITWLDQVPITVGAISMEYTPVKGTVDFVVHSLYNGGYNTVETFRVTGNGNASLGGITAPTAQFDTTGTVRMRNFGAGAATFDALGQISSVSDEKVKTNVNSFTAGLKELLNINPITFKYTKESGLDTENFYPGFSAQNVKDAVSEIVYSKTDVEYVIANKTSVGTNMTTGEKFNYIETYLKEVPKLNDKGEQTYTLSVYDRGLMAVMVNAIKEQQADLDAKQVIIDKQQGQIDDLTKRMEALEAKVK